jgi:lipopolysaccharide transport system ATP-binding protein
MKAAIRVDGISKCYRLGHAPIGSQTLGETIRTKFKGMLGGNRGPASNDFWAVKDVGFEVQPGEAVGIIGRNGAGKSTLLKLLSRITEPTEGRAAVKGRLGSLLEVGTGFHPELTGRENIYLNGSILGMSRFEIQRNFDDIVQFAEIERFLDTPVKRYSSGMYVRLAFAIAAHLQPEVLILDEVLAVGDSVFQKRCLGKMKDVASEGRTILFVSHDMAALRRLCKRIILLNKGKLVADGPTEEVLTKYLTEDSELLAPGRTFDLRANKRHGTGEAKIVAIRAEAGWADPEPAFRSDKPIDLHLTVESDVARRIDTVSVAFINRNSTKLVNLDTIRLQDWSWDLKPGLNQLHLQIESLHLMPGNYYLNFWLARRPGATFDFMDQACEIEILPVKGDDRPRPNEDGTVTCEFRVLGQE